MDNNSEVDRRRLLLELEQIEKKLFEIDITDKGEETKELESLLEEQTYVRAYESSYNFLMHSWHTFEPNEFVQSKHLHSIGEHLDACLNGQIKNLIINIAPRNSKTSIVTRAFPAYCWIKNPGLKIVNVSYSANLATDDCVASKQIITHDWYQKGLRSIWKEINNWDYVWELSKTTNLKNDYYTTLNGRRFSTSTGGTFTGKGGDIIIIDDPLNANDSHSKIEREKCNQWSSQTLSTRLNDKEKGIRILVMQRLHEQDLTGYLLEQGNWDLLTIPTEWDETQRYFTSIGWTDWRTKDKELMNPIRFPRNSVEELKTELGEYGFASQQQQQPVPLGGGLIKDTWWNTWYVVPSYFDSAVISMDLNTKEGLTNDNTALIVMGKKNADIYILDLVYKNMDIVKQLEEIEKICEKYKYIRQKIIEDKSNGSAVWSLLKRKIPGLVAVDPKGINKNVRIMSTVPYINAGNVYIPNKEICDWINPLLVEASMFPKGKYDDALDAFAYGIDYLINNNTYTKVPAEIITNSSNVISRAEIRSELIDTYYGEQINTDRMYLRNLFN